MDTPRFDTRALASRAGGTTFSRGEAYFRDGLVTILGREPQRVVARVSGTEDYRTVVVGVGRAIAGNCSCPAFDRDGFCKHMVAVALAANAAADTGEPGGDIFGRIRAYLSGLDTGALVGMVMDAAEQDPVLLRRLEIAVAANAADDGALAKQLRTAIRDATRTRGFVDYGAAPEWAADVGQALELLAGIASGPRAALAVELADYAIDQIEDAMEEIDDSEGECWALIERAQEIHLEACQAARPEPVALAQALFEREMESDHDAFYGAARSYADVLGEAGLAEYRRLAQEAWDRLPPRMAPRRGVIEYRPGESALASILDFFLERDGDLDARIAMRARDLSSPHRYLELARFCLAHGRESEALRHAEDALWLFEDGAPDEQLLLFAVGLLEDAGRAADATAHLWRAFGKAPSLRLYEHLRRLAGEQVVNEIITLLRGRLAGTTASRWHSPADLLIRILMAESMFDAAWSVVGDHGASSEVKQVLASATEKTHLPQAIAVHEARVEEHVAAANNTSYANAAALIERLAALRGAAEQSAYVADIKLRHARKRNFMKLLG